MKKQLPIGLLVEGNSTNSLVLRLAHVAEELGPVKSGARRLARRVSNYLDAGYAVEHYEDLQAARLILIHAPPQALPHLLEELGSSDLVFRNLSFVLSESWLPSETLKPLSDRGASVATLVAASSIGRDWFIVEGQGSAVRQVRRLLERSDSKVLEISPGTKDLYFAAELLITMLPVPLLTAAREALRASGITGKHLYSFVDVMAQKMLRDVAKGSRSSIEGALNRCPPETAASYIESLRLKKPPLADLIEDALAAVQRPKARRQAQAQRAANA